MCVCCQYPNPAILSISGGIQQVLFNILNIQMIKEKK